MAVKLIKQETKPFIAEDYRDTYTEELEDLIRAKTKGKKPLKHDHDDTPAKKTSAHDIMASLKASLRET